MVHYWGFSALGIGGHLGKFFNFKQGPIPFFVGILEAISEVAKVISFYLPSVRKHIRGRGAARGDDIPHPADRHNPVPGS